jgi:replicative DNA helicase
MAQPKSLDERLIALVVNGSGAREVFSRLKNSEQLEDHDTRRMFDAAAEIYERGGRRAQQINADAIVEELKQRGHFSSIPTDKLERCLDGMVDRRNDLDQTITTIASRKVTKQIQETIEKLKTATGDDAIHLAAEITKLKTEKSGAAGSKLITLSEWTDDIDSIWNPPDCVSTGFPLWDERLGGGFIKGNYHIFAGFTGSGKSIMTLSIFMNMIRAGVKALYFNYEIPFDYFRQIMFSQITGANPLKFKQEHSVRDRYEEQFVAEITKLYELGLLNVSDPARGASSVWDEAEDMMKDVIERTNAEIIFFDTINSVSARTKSGQDARWNEYETISMAAERLTMAYNVAMVFTAQPKQEVMSREDKTPQLYDVAGGKVISEKAASISHLHRADLLDPTHRTDFSEIHITKNRVFGTEFGNKPIRVKYDENYKRLYELPAAQQTHFTEPVEEAPEESHRPPIPPLPGLEIDAA